MLLAIAILDTVLRPGDDAKGWILVAGIWGYLLIFWRPWRRPGSGDGSAASQQGRRAGGHPQPRGDRAAH